MKIILKITVFGSDGFQGEVVGLNTLILYSKINLLVKKELCNISMAFYNIRKIKLQLAQIGNLHYSNKLPKDFDYKKYYQMLGIPECSNKEEIKSAYLEMVKRYHPDSVTPEANADKFREIDKAFRILMDKITKDNTKVEDKEEEVPDISHTAPQHRQYLNYEGVGYGSPFQREKQYLRVKVSRANENVMNHRVAKAAIDDKTLVPKVLSKHKIKTKYGFDRLVEDLIQESISKGHFNNLSGVGKPLPDVHSKNPYVDFVTHKLNEILIENGFTPRWISLQKEIRLDVGTFRNTLCLERSKFSPFPLSIEENIKWSDVVYKHKYLIDEINKKINRYNLLVPVLQRQMLLLSLKNEAQNILIRGRSKKDIINSCRLKEKDTDKEENFATNFLKLLELLFKKISKK